MKNKINAMTIAIWTLAVLPIPLLGALYSHLPAQVPTHWNLDGSVTYSGRASLWVIALLPLGCTALFRLLPRIDPKGRNYSRFMGSYETFQLVFLLFMLAVQGFTLVETFRPGTLDVSVWVTALVSLLFVFLGNMMPKFRQNFFCGFKTPWTLSSETVWVKTHRLGGRAFVAAGLVGLGSCFVSNQTVRFVLLLGGITVAAVLPLVMSYCWYRQEQQSRQDK